MAAAVSPFSSERERTNRSYQSIWIAAQFIALNQIPKRIDRLFDVSGVQE